MIKYFSVVLIIILFTLITYAQKDSIKTIKFVKILRNESSREKILIPKRDFIILTTDFRKTKVKFDHINIIDSRFIYTRKDVSKKVIYNIGDTIQFKDLKMVEGTTNGYIFQNLISLPAILIGGPIQVGIFLFSGLYMINPVFIVPTADVFVRGIVGLGIYKKLNTTNKWKIKSCIIF